MQQLSPALSVGLRYVDTNLLNEPSLAIPASNTTLAPAAILNGPFSYTLKKQKITTQSVMATLRYRLGQQDNKIYLNNSSSTNLNGFYISTQLGAMYPALNNNNSHLYARYQDRGGITNLPEISLPITSQSNSPSVNIGLGFGKILVNNIYLGLEGALNWSKKNIKSGLYHEYRPITTLIAGQTPDSIRQKLNLDINNLEPSLSSKLGLLLPYNLFSQKLV